MKLAAGVQQDIDDRMKELSDSRRTKQPLEYPSAGSTFKRPEGYFAGKLIMDAGLRDILWEEHRCPRSTADLL